MIGYRSVQHQGWAAAKARKAHNDGPNSYIDFDESPYPPKSAAFYEFQDGCNADRRGDVIDCRGNIVSPGAQTHQHANVHRQGTGW